MIPSKDEQSALVHEGGGGSEAAGRPATGDAGGGASIDKVRDLLFGGQLRELDRRFARLEGPQLRVPAMSRRATSVNGSSQRRSTTSAVWTSS